MKIRNRVTMYRIPKIKQLGYMLKDRHLLAARRFELALEATSNNDDGGDDNDR